MPAWMHIAGAFASEPGLDDESANAQHVCVTSNSSLIGTLIPRTVSTFCCFEMLTYRHVAHVGSVMVET